MAASGSRPPGGHGERRTIGLFSLGFGLLLLALILVRGQQAAREGNQELRNDTYWVLVSPLVFSGFGLYLLRNPSKGVGAPQRRKRTTTAPAVAIPRLERQVETSDRQSAQVQQALEAAVAETERQLAQARNQLATAEAAARAAEQRQHQVAGDAQQRIVSLEQQLEQARQAHSRAREEVQTLQSLSQSSAGTEGGRVLALHQRLESLASSLQEELHQARREQERSLADQRGELDRLQRELESRLVDADQAHRRDGGELEALKQTLGGLQQQLQTLETERQQLLRRLDALGSSRRNEAETAFEASRLVKQQLEGLGSRFSDQERTLSQTLDRLLEQQTSAIGELRSAMTSALGALEASQAEQTARAEAAASRLMEMEQQIQQAQQDGRQRSREVAQTLAGLEDDRGRLRSDLESARQRVEQITGRLNDQLAQAREDAAKALRTSQEARELLERLQQSGAGSAEGWSEPAAGHAPLLAAYREACEELGLMPGSSWTVVRATWRRNLKQWHPDQGGDAGRWNRRNGAYELLSAWYAFAEVGD